MAYVKIPFPSLMTDMLDYCDREKKRLFAEKVLRVYLRCHRSGRKELAEAIKAKYAKEMNSIQGSDMAVAFMYTLLANKNK